MEETIFKADMIIEDRIYTIRGRRIMLDQDLALLYEVGTKVLNQAVKRNLSRFPEDFMFELTKEEVQILRSQSVTSSWGGSRYLPKAFTEQGVAMLSSVLSSEKAIQVNIHIIRIFTRLREELSTQKEMLFRIDRLENDSSVSKKDIASIFSALRQLIAESNEPREPVGYKTAAQKN